MRRLLTVLMMVGLVGALTACGLVGSEPQSGDSGEGGEITGGWDGDDPQAPEGPAEPEIPGTPTEPVDPGAPTEPDDPGTPTEPVDPGAPTEPTDPGTPQPPDEPDPGEPTLASRMLAAVNVARAEGALCGTSWHAPTTALALSAQLVEAAQAHSDDMLGMRTMSHTGSDGSGPGERIARTGYRASTWGENVAYGYRSVEQVMSGWLGSEGHCKNIMNPSFTEFGAGEAGFYWTHVFGRPR